MNEVILEMRNITKRFGNNIALQNMNLNLRKGEVHAIVGENGAGKSTLIKILGGIYQPDEGEIIINGSKVAMENVLTARQNGIAIINQEIALVPHLSIAENIFLGREITKGFGFQDSYKMLVESKEMLQKIGLNLDSGILVKDLSIAQQQMVEIAKAISFDAKILVMDEPTSSLSADDVRVLTDIIKNLQKEDVSIIYISHRLEEVFALSQRITILRDGLYINTLKTQETDNDEVISLMVGRSLSNYYIRTYNKGDSEILRVENLVKKQELFDVTFSVSAGEVLGFFGLIGSGRSELMRCIFAADNFDSGRIFFCGEEVYFRNSYDAIQAGIAMVPEDRKNQGLTMVESIYFNINLASIDKLIATYFIDKTQATRQAHSIINKLNIKSSNMYDSVSSLSGGNQQKVVLGKWLAIEPKLLILDEPTRGIDVGSKSEIYSIINRLAEKGIAIILVSSDLPEVINMSDRIAVFKDGHIVGEINHDNVSQKLIMEYATGSDCNV